MFDSEKINYLARLENLLKGISKTKLYLGNGEITNNNPLPVEIISGSSGGGNNVDREIIVSLYRCKTTFVGANIGDVISATRVLDVSGNSATQVGATIWYNETSAATLATTPNAANIELVQNGYLTDAQLRASAIPVSPNISRGFGNVDANTQRVTLASDGPTVTALTSIDTKTPSMDNSKQPVIPSMTSGGNTSVQTAATGANWTAFASQACKQLTLSNQSGTTIEVRQGAAGVGLQIPSGAFYTFFGITNANQLEVRRVDTSNTQVTITARWEA